MVHSAADFTSLLHASIPGRYNLRSRYGFVSTIHTSIPLCHVSCMIGVSALGLGPAQWVRMTGPFPLGLRSSLPAIRRSIVHHSILRSFRSECSPSGDGKCLETSPQTDRRVSTTGRGGRPLRRLHIRTSSFYWLILAARCITLRLPG